MTATNLAVGDVFYLRCTLCAPPKNKYFVLAQVSPARMFVVNSKLNEFEAARPEIVAAKAPIFCSENTFFPHDSFVCCDQVSHEFAQNLPAVLAKDPSAYIGALGPRARQAVADALALNDLLPRKYLREIKPLWP